MHLETGLVDLLHLAVRFETGGKLQRGAEYFQLQHRKSISTSVAVAYNLCSEQHKTDKIFVDPLKINRHICSMRFVCVHRI